MQKKSFSGHKSMTLKTNISTSLTAPYRFFSYGVKIKSCLNKKWMLWKTLSSFSSCCTDYFTSCNQDFSRLYKYFYICIYFLLILFWMFIIEVNQINCFYLFVDMNWDYSEISRICTLKGKNNLDVLNVWNLTHSWLK